MKKNTIHEFAFSRENYRLMIIGVIIVVIGYLLMIGGGTENPAEFSEEIFSFRRLTLSPLVILAGFIVVFVAIMKKPKV